MAIKRYDSRVLMQMAKDNNAKLDGCVKHHFDVKPPYKLGQKFTCFNCGGEMDALQAFRYCQGFEAAGGNPNEVIANFK